jgi:hypothetical protein
VRRVLAAAHFDGAAVTLLVAGGAAGVALAIVFVVRYAATFPALPTPGPETAELGDETPAVANLLVNRCTVTRVAAASTIVDLAARRFLELFEAGPGRYVVRLRSVPGAGPLAKYEEQVLQLVRARATGGSAPLEAVQLDEGQVDAWHDRFRKGVVAEAKARGLLRGRWSRLDWALFAVLAGAALALVAAGLDVAGVEGATRAGSSTRRFPREDWFVVAVGAWLVVLGVIATFRSVRYSSSGTSAAARWLGVKRYLRRDPAFADAPPAAVAVWGRLLAYGTAFGVSRATAAAIPLAGEDRATAWSRAGGDWHQVHVEYPRHFGYGQRPLPVLLGGLVRVVFWGGLAFALLPFIADRLWTAGRDAIDPTHLSSAAVVAVVAAFFVGFGVVGIGLLARVADGLVRLARGAADLGRVRTVEGPVVKVVGAGRWFAVDPGHVEHVQAWHSGDLGLPTRGATVRVTLTPHLRHVTAISILEEPPGGGVDAAATPTGGTAPRPVPVDAAAVDACAGLALAEVAPESIAGFAPSRVPVGAAVRAFSDGTSRILVIFVPEGAGLLEAAGPAGVARRLHDRAAGGRWSQDRVLIQLTPAGLVIVDVDLAGRSSAEREQVARALAARVAASAAPSPAPVPPPGPPLG